jgi:hypothetical protein
MRPRALTLMVVALALPIAGALGLGTMTPASAQQGPIGAWEVRHGQLGEVWAFAQSGDYYYQIYSMQFGSLTKQVEGGGTFAVQGNRLIVRPSTGEVRTFLWRIGTHVTALPGEPVLFLRQERGGGEKFYYHCRGECGAM